MSANLKQKFDNFEHNIRNLVANHFDEFLNTMMINSEEIKIGNLENLSDLKRVLESKIDQI